MNRRLAILFLLLVVPTFNRAAVQCPPGPQLLIDDQLIASKSNVIRRPLTLTRNALSEAPILTAEKHRTFQPFFTVIYDQGQGVFRLWYGIPTEDRSHVRSRIAYTESNDGVTWTNTPRVLGIGPVQFGASVIDEGAKFPKPEQRYKLGWYFEDGLFLATSPDGLRWDRLAESSVLKHNHDINGIFYDSLRSRYTAVVSFFLPGEAWSGNRRITKQSCSTNLLAWTEPAVALSPDSRDEGETQFYAMDGFLRRSDLLLGMVKVLRDDLKADNPPEPPDAYGIGYTTVAWTRDGENWMRERAPFLDRNPRRGAWDHAHAWIDEQVPVGDEVYLYYAGYKSGHKVNRFEERQIGLIKIKRDRYIALESTGQGILRTKPLLLDGKRLFINADAARGEVRVQVLTPDGMPIEGYAFADCSPIQVDSVTSPVRWAKAPPPLPREPVVLEFSIENAALFAFELM